MSYVKKIREDEDRQTNRVVDDIIDLWGAYENMGMEGSMFLNGVINFLVKTLIWGYDIDPEQVENAHLAFNEFVEKVKALPKKLPEE